MGIRIINFKEVVNMSEEEGQSWQDFLDFMYEDKNRNRVPMSVLNMFLVKIQKNVKKVQLLAEMTGRKKKRPEDYRTKLISI